MDMKIITLRYYLRSLVLLASSCLVTPSFAVNYAQMQGMLGFDLIDQRVAYALQHYGLPNCIVDHSDATAPRQTITWQTATLQLGKGDWSAFFNVDAVHPTLQSSARACQWTNKNAAAQTHSKYLLSFVTKGQSRLPIFKTYPEKSTNDIPTDPLLAQKIRQATVALSNPLPLATLHSAYVAAHTDHVDASTGQPYIRYWVEHISFNAPIELFAVEFLLDPDKTHVIAYRIRNSDHDDVLKEFTHRQEGWFSNMAD